MNTESDINNSGKSVLVMCSERSGSNLLKGMLNEHRDLFIGPPIPLFECFSSIEQKYGDLDEDQNWNALLSDCVAMLRVNHQPLPRAIDVEDLENSYSGKTRTVGGIIDTVFRICAESRGAGMSGYKYSTNMATLGEFDTMTSFSHVIYQVRDPRDVALSHFKGGVNKETPKEATERWRNSQEQIEGFLTRSNLPRFRVRYEDLLKSPSETIQDIWGFLGFDNCTADPMNFFRSKDNVLAAEKTHMWENLGKPLIADNSEKFYSDWNYQAIKEIENHIGESLVKYEYALADEARFSGDNVPVRRPLKDGDLSYIQPQLDLWKEIHERLG